LVTEVSPLVDRAIELEELVEKWTLLDDEQVLVAGKRGATRLGFASPVHRRSSRKWNA
jgi:hypothetical protein